MKLINKIVKINEITFQPELEVTIRLPLEPLQDQSAQDPSIYEQIGHTLISLLTTKETI